MPKFAKGHGKLGGRAPGTPNHITCEVRELALSLVADADYLKRFKQRLLSGKMNPVLERMAWEYAHGRPRQQVDVEWSSAGPLPLDTVREVYQEVERARKAKGKD